MNRFSSFSVLLFCLTAVGCQSTTKNDPDSVAKLLRASVKEINNAAPMMLNDETRLNSANTSGNTITYLYTLTNAKIAGMDIGKFVDVMKKQVNVETCRNEGMKVLVQNKVIVAYNYFDNEGKSITKINVDTSNCPANQKRLK
jgi:hypothetical protein